MRFLPKPVHADRFIKMGKTPGRAVLPVESNLGLEWFDPWVNESISRLRDIYKVNLPEGVGFLFIPHTEGSLWLPPEGPPSYSNNVVISNGHVALAPSNSEGSSYANANTELGVRCCDYGNYINDGIDSTDPADNIARYYDPLLGNYRESDDWVLVMTPGSVTGAFMVNWRRKLILLPELDLGRFLMANLAPGGDSEQKAYGMEQVICMLVLGLCYIFARSEFNRLVSEMRSSVSEVNLARLIDSTVQRSVAGIGLEFYQLVQLQNKVINLARDISILLDVYHEQNYKEASRELLIKSWKLFTEKFPSAYFGNSSVSFTTPPIDLGGIPMGVYRVTGQLKSNSDRFTIVRIYTPPNAEEVNHPHPHIDEDGNPCLGQWLPLITSAIAEGNFLRMAQHILSFLRSYDINTCFVRAKLGEWNLRKPGEKEYLMDPNDLPKLIHNGVVVKGKKLKQTMKPDLLDNLEEFYASIYAAATELQREITAIE